MSAGLTPIQRQQIERARERPIRFEDMIALVHKRMTDRERLRRAMRDEGLLREPIEDREQRVLAALWEFLGCCTVCRAEVNKAIAPARVRRPMLPRESGEGEDR